MNVFRNTKEKVAALSVSANILLAFGKILIGIVSNSAAVLAEGIHSFMDIFSSAISYLGIRTARKPADKKHPYGYYKFEVLSGIIITLILLGTGAAIVYKAYKNFLYPQTVHLGYLVFSVMMFSAVLNEIMARLKIYYGKKENSISLLSDGIHSRVDVFTSLGVFAGLFLVKYWIHADSVLAFLIGIYIIKESFPIGKEAIDSLLDVSAGEEIENKIKSIAKSQNIEVSSLKTQKKGPVITANLEIKLPKNLSVEEATRVSQVLREKLMKEIENLSYVAIQIKTHEVETSFYRPAFGRGFGWQRRGRFRKDTEKAEAKGPGGYCVCPKCGYRIEHQRGVPCSTLKCPRCNIFLQRQ